MSKIAVAVPISGLGADELSRRAQLVRAHLPPDIEAEIVTSPAAPKFLDAQQHFGDAVDAAVEFFANIDPGEFALVVSAGALDPGLARARVACPVPVIGPGEASLYLASIFGRPLSVVTVDEFAVVATHEWLAEVAVKPPIASVRSMDLPVRVMVQDLERGRETLVRQCELAVSEDGAEALYLGSMTLGTLGVADGLRRSLGVPVFDPMRIAMSAAAQCVYAIRGTTQS
jgi:Asp/Glu/hydantoin racemase